MVQLPGAVGQNSDHLVHGQRAHAGFQHKIRAGKAEIVKGYRNTVLRQRAKLAYDKARYYDILAKKPKAALIAYRALVAQFPHSDWTGLAQIRIDALSKLVPPDDTHEEAASPGKEDGT